MSIKKLSKKLLACLSALFMIFQLSSCYSINTYDFSDYESFLQEMKNRNFVIDKYLPDKKTCQIEDMYLYYSDELIDSYYSIYLNCSYTKEQYETELQRIVDLTSHRDIFKENLNFFSYDSICLENTLDFDSMGIGIMRYIYFLFDSENNKIVYVMIFEKEVFGKSVNIPIEFLPSELIELRNNANYTLETVDQNEYILFLNKAKSSYLSKSEMLPKSEDTACIEDMYLYYSYEEFTKTTYAIYLNCVYGSDEYKVEKQRIFDKTSMYDPEYISKSDSSNFKYDALVVTDSLWFYEVEKGIIKYKYFLFDNENGRIIYVFISEKNLFGKSVNIPQEYLPNDVIALRSKTDQKD